MAYTFTNIINPADPTFNQLLGINDSDVIAGYNGSGVPGHPNQGYTTTTAGTTFTPEYFPGSVQTQVVGINNKGTTVGFYSPTNNGSDANFGFWTKNNGSSTAVVNPLTTSKPSTNQLLGINDNGVAVGFYNDSNGNSHGYKYNLTTGAFTPVVDSAAAAVSLTATAINNAGDIAGFYSTSGGLPQGFLDVGGTFTTISLNTKGSTEIFGMNNDNELVGETTGSGGKMFGFLYNDSTKATQFFNIGGLGTTTINGINDSGDLVGFYTNSTGYTIGLLGQPAAPKVANTGATAQSFDAWSTLAPDAGMSSSLQYAGNGRGYDGRGYEGLNVAVASDGPHYD